MQRSEVNRYISDPGGGLKLGQKVKVKVLEVDIARKRIASPAKQTEKKVKQPFR